MSQESKLARVIPLGSDVLSCSGLWTVLGMSALTLDFEEVLPEASLKTVDLSGVEALDSGGALLLQALLEAVMERSPSVQVTGLKAEFQALLAFIQQAHQRAPVVAPVEVEPGLFEAIGRKVMKKLETCIGFFRFVGQLSVSALNVFLTPRRFDVRGVLVNVDQAGYESLPIVALLSFLVGVVVAYQMALQLSLYGANIYVVDLSGVIVLREFGPLLAAIIAAGRTSTAYTAQIGAMKVNEELDALQTMGVSPIERLVIPKILGVIIALPLVTVWADLFGVFGAMLMSKIRLGIPYLTFLHRFQHVVAAKHYLLGLVKAPVFAVLIAAVGCFQGFQVLPTADSVGRKTTQSAVQALFLVIIADAAFSVLFSWRGL